MDYAAFLAYRKTLSKVKYALDELNLYPLQAKIANNHPLKKFSYKGYIKKSSGIRELLQTLFNDFLKQDKILYLPEDVYPVYFKLAGKSKNIKQYQSCQKSFFNLPKQENAVLLITHPLIPEGRYLSLQQCVALKQWLAESSQRCLIIDSVYDFKQQSLDLFFNLPQVIFLMSLSKIASPLLEKQGWALSQTPFLDSIEKKQESIIIPIGRAKLLQETFEKAWFELKQSLDLVQIPQVGYLTTIEGNYKDLYQQYGLSCIPNTVFGIKNNNISVISCLAVIPIKHISNPT